MRLKEAESVVAIPGSRLHIHNVGHRDLNRNQQDKISDSSDLHSTQWASNYVTSSNTTLLKDHLTNNGSNFNHNITATLQQQQQQQNNTSYTTSSDLLSESSPDDSLGDYDVDVPQSSSSEQDECRSFLSDTDSLSDDGNLPPPRTARGIVNPNYPGFQHLAHHLDHSDTDEGEDEADNNNVYNNNNNNNNNNNGDEEEEEPGSDSVNHLGSDESFQKAFYDKPKFNIPVEPEILCVVDPIAALIDLEKDLNVQLVEECDKPEPGVDGDCEEGVKALEREIGGIELVPGGCCEEDAVEMSAMAMVDVQQVSGAKMADAILSNAKEELLSEEVSKCDLVRSAEEAEEREKFTKEEQTASEKEKDEDSVVPRKKEKMEINYNVKKNRHGFLPDAGLPANMSAGVVRRREFGPRARDIMLANRRSMPAAREKKRSSPEMLGGFDVYNIETAMPKIDLDAIESHLRAAREEERRRRNDREEIRRRLAMGSDADEYYGGDRPGRKPSLQARLQSGMNLQICFMNETVSDTESPNSDSEPAASPVKPFAEKPAVIPHSHMVPAKSPGTSPTPLKTRPSTSMLTLPLRREPEPVQPMTEADFFARQARLQAEARMALAQAKEMAHMQMEIERQRQKKSPITEMVRSSLEKVGIPFPEDRRRVSRQLLTEMNLAQLQVIVNDLHTQIEVLNEGLVKFLMNRDDLHMEQDSMLVDIEDLTRYLGAKEQPLKEQKESPTLTQNNNNLLSSKPKLNRIAGIVKK